MNEQADPSLPTYTITGLDNIYSPMDKIPIQVLHFKNDNGAIKFSKAYGKQQGWHTWEVYCGRRKVYYVNQNTKEEWPMSPKAKPAKKKGRKDKRNHGSKQKRNNK